MKLSYYNYVFDFKNDYIMFNSVSGAIIVIDSLFLDNLNKGLYTKDEKELLYKMGFLVEDDCNEFERILFFNKTNEKKQETKIYTICPTTCCNARCFYCFEKGRKHSTMSENIVNKTVEFIIKDFRDSKAKNLCLSWFGGEPLLSMKIIKKITKSLLDAKIVDKNCFSAKITTNGILINDNILEEIKNNKIDTVQITLDGYGDEYNNRKNYINEINSFNKIIQIIKKLTDNKIIVSLRLNYDDKNFSSICDLIKFLNKEFTAEQKKFIVSYPAKLEKTQNCSICNTSADKNFISILKLLLESNISKSFKQLNLKYRFAHCLIDSEFSYVIGADGNLYKCNECVDDNSCKVGTVFVGVNKKTMPKLLENSCKSCKFLPICQGGCSMRAKEIDSFSKCQIEKYMLGDILRLYIEKGGYSV